KIVMEMVNPVKNEIIEVYDAAMSLLNTIDAPTANITDIVKKSSLAINELQKLRKRLVKEARSTDLIDEKLAKLNDTWSTAVKNAVNYGATHEVATQST
ncbi:MAG: hypothetical protein KDH96_09390, partial [Candidatus Riesia sp.]|nr:hypothetical protein [Candidatus Riesia sp.]